MNNLTEAAVSIMTLIVGAGILALLVSKNANTSQVITSSGNAFSNMLATAMSPVTGYNSGVSSQMSLYGVY